MHGGGHARRIGVPVQKVEGERLLAQQVVVDDERPDQVVVAHHVEGGGHVAAFEVALLVHALIEVGELLLVDENAELAGLFEVHHGGQEGGGAHPAVPFGVGRRRHVGQGAGQQRAADAIADDVDLALTGRLFDRFERRQRTLDHVVVEALVGEGAVRVDPGDDENRVSLAHRPLDEGIILAQIQDVELVDPRRHDQ